MFLIHDKAVDLGISMRLKYGFLLEVRLHHGLCIGFDSL